MTRKKVFSADFKSLAKISQFIEESADRSGFAAEEIYSLTLAVDEACSNVIEHGFPPDNTESIEITVTDQPKTLEIDIIDKGIPFDLSKAGKVSLPKKISKRSEGGMGIFFIQQYIDVIQYRTEGGRNILSLVKYKK
ncbi:MAG TPA: ATP-binding protein [Bellilinea sp.]|nr:ATP-binding protein [Bellilinea sp.]